MALLRLTEPKGISLLPIATGILSTACNMRALGLSMTKWLVPFSSLMRHPSRLLPSKAIERLERLELAQHSLSIGTAGTVHPLLLIFPAHQESISICGVVSTKDPAREIALSASLIGSPRASSTEIASMAVRPTPPAQ
jgi:hypothetical protein